MVAARGPRPLGTRGTLARDRLGICSRAGQGRAAQGPAGLRLLQSTILDNRAGVSTARSSANGANTAIRLDYHSIAVAPPPISACACGGIVRPWGRVAQGPRAGPHRGSFPNLGPRYPEFGWPIKQTWVAGRKGTHRLFGTAAARPASSFVAARFGPPGAGITMPQGDGADLFPQGPGKEMGRTGIPGRLCFSTAGRRIQFFLRREKKLLHHRPIPDGRRRPTRGVGFESGLGPCNPIRRDRPERALEEKNRSAPSDCFCD